MPGVVRAQAKDWCISEYNFMDKSIKMPDKVIINDCTLREGDQVLGTAMSIEEKIELAKALDKAGIPQFESGAGRTISDVKTIAGLNLKANLGILISPYQDEQDKRKEIIAALEHGVDTFKIGYLFSDHLIKFYNGMSRVEVTNLAVETVKFAKTNGAFVAVSPFDVLRAPFVEASTFYRAVIDAGADEIRVEDGVGASFPAGMRLFVRKLRKNFPNVRIAVHTHNDLGLALANSLSAVEAGADVVDVTVNGLGERAGVTSLAELAVILNMCGVDTGLRLDKLYDLAKMVENITKVPVPINQPLVGLVVFSHCVEAHVLSQTLDCWAWNCVSLSLVGAPVRTFVSKFSGPAATKAKLNEMGIVLPDSVVSILAEEIRKEEKLRRRILTNNDVHRIIKKLGKNK